MGYTHAPLVGLSLDPCDRSFDVELFQPELDLAEAEIDRLGDLANTQRFVTAGFERREDLFDRRR